MFGDLGAPELLIILAIVVLLFGVGKVGRLGKDLGTAVKEFRSAVKDEDEKKAEVAPPPPPQLVDQAVVTPAGQAAANPPPVQAAPAASPGETASAKSQSPNIF